MAIQNGKAVSLIAAAPKSTSKISLFKEPENIGPETAKAAEHIRFINKMRSEYNQAQNHNHPLSFLKPGETFSDFMNEALKQANK